MNLRNHKNKHLNKMARKPGSLVRARIISLLQQHGEMHGYKLAILYNKEYAKVSQRLIYYHLKKGVNLEEIKISKIVEEKGDYSWGNKVSRVYYKV